MMILPMVVGYIPNLAREKEKQKSKLLPWAQIKHNFKLAIIVLFLLAELKIFVTRKGHSTHVIDAISFLTLWDAKIQKGSH